MVYKKGYFIFLKANISLRQSIMHWMHLVFIFNIIDL